MGKSLAKDEGAGEYDSRTLAVVVESLVVKGDVSLLSPEDKARFYVQMCTQLGLNPASNPLAVLKLNGKEVFYPTRGATDQLAAIHRLNREIVDGPKVIDVAGTKLVYAMCRATHPNGRVETAVATVPLTDPANVLMRAETKAKRRATLSILGLGMLDESELETIPERLKSEAPPIDLGVLDAKQNEPPTSNRTALATLEASVAEAKDLEQLALVWIDLRPAFANASHGDQTVAWAIVVDRALPWLKATDRKSVTAVLKAAIKRAEGPQEPPPEHSTGEHRAAPPAADAEGDAEAAEAAAIAAEGNSARQWIERAERGDHSCVTYLVRSWLAHKDEFGPDFEDARAAFFASARKHHGYGELSLKTLVTLEAAARSTRLQSARKGHLKLVRRAA